MIMALDAWVDAGSAATSAATLLSEGATVIAGIETDGLYDYRSRRPTLRIVDGRPVELDWPRLAVLHRRLARRDILILSGPEPDYRWRELAAEMVLLARTWASPSGSRWAPSPLPCPTRGPSRCSASSPVRGSSRVVSSRDRRVP